MHRHRLLLFSRSLIAIDVFVSALAFLATFYGRQWVAVASAEPGLLPAWVMALEVPAVEDPALYHQLLLGMLPVWWLVLYVSNAADFRSTYRQIFVRYARAIAMGLACFIAATFLFKLTFVARSFVLLFGLVNLGFLIVGRYIVMESIAFVRSKRIDGHRVVVVGCNDRALAYAHSLRTQPPWNIRLLGHVWVPGENVNEAPVEDLGPIDKLDELLDSTPVDEVLFAHADLGEELLANALHACDERGVDVLLPLPASVPPRAQVEIANLDGFDLPMLGLRRTPTNEVGLALKRLIDITGAGLMLLFASPVMLVVSIIIKLSSPGPVLFQQTRAGRNGRKFVMFKFRSMVVDAERRREQLLHLNEMSGPVFKIRRDPRVTKIGSFIRRTSIDELPQLFNIVFGNMSLVGPRPPLPSEVEQYKPWQRRRLSVKPGLTGLWQVSGRNNVDFEEWMRLDLRYIDDWSIWLDLKILFRTLPAVLFKTGAS